MKNRDIPQKGHLQGTVYTPGPGACPSGISRTTVYRKPGQRG